MSRKRVVFILLFIISLSSCYLDAGNYCQHNEISNNDYSIYAYDEINDVELNITATGFGKYGQLLQEYYCGWFVQTILENDDDYFYIKNNKYDEGGENKNTIILTYTFNSQIVKTFETNIEIAAPDGIISYAIIAYNGDENITITNSYNEIKSYELNSQYDKIELIISTLKYYLYNNQPVNRAENEIKFYYAAPTF